MPPSIGHCAIMNGINTSDDEAIGLPVAVLSKLCICLCLTPITSIAAGDMGVDSTQRARAASERLQRF